MRSIQQGLLANRRNLPQGQTEAAGSRPQGIGWADEVQKGVRAGGAGLSITEPPFPVPKERKSLWLYQTANRQLRCLCAVWSPT